MKSAHPEDAASGELLVMVSGASIELKALGLRLERAGARVVPIPSDGRVDESAPVPDLLVCDLASDGALAAVERCWSASLNAVRPQLIALGTPRGDVSEAGQALLAQARHRFRRPLDIQGVAQEVLGLSRQPRPSTRAASGELPYASVKARSSRAPKLSLPPLADVAPSSHPSSSPAALVVDDPVGAQSRPLASPPLEHSVISAELETLLAEAERRVQAQVVMQSDPLGSNPPNGSSGQLSNDVWDALGEPLDDDADNPLADAVQDDGPLPSPLARDAERSLMPLPGDSTIPPDLWENPGHEITGAHAPAPESEKTSGSLHPLTAAGNTAEPATLPPGPAHGIATSRAGAGTGRRGAERSLMQSTEPPSTAPPAARGRAPSPPPWHATPPSSSNPVEPPASEAPASGDGRGTLSLDEDLPASSRPDLDAEGELPARLELPGALVRGAPALVIGRAVRQRFTGCLAFEVDQGLRRIVFKEGDVVIAASAVHGESLVSFLVQRGDLATDTAAQIEHRIPVFGRHAGAALIARGLLEQNELWPVLRAHAEWVLAQLLLIERGAVQLELPVPERLAAEPSVFGGSTGAEVLVEVIQRALSPAQAVAYLGSDSATLVAGGAFSLLSECALSPAVVKLVLRAAEVGRAELLAEAADEPMLPCILHALCVLDVLQVREPAPRGVEKRPRLRRAVAAPDQLDDEALRGKVQARRALVDDGDYFALLGVSRQATGYDIRRSYTDLRRQFDPGQVLRPNTLDLADDVDTILEVLDEAYEILRDPQRRERYRRAIESVP
jgi:hypothetical protein